MVYLIKTNPVYLQNRYPNSAINNKTLSELWTGKVLNLAHLLLAGLNLILKQKRTHLKVTRQNLRPTNLQILKPER